MGERPKEGLSLSPAEEVRSQILADPSGRTFFQVIGSRVTTLSPLSFESFLEETFGEGFIISLSTDQEGKSRALFLVSRLEGLARRSGGGYTQYLYEEFRRLRKTEEGFFLLLIPSRDFNQRERRERKRLIEGWRERFNDFSQFASRPDRIIAEPRAFFEKIFALDYPGSHQQLHQRKRGRFSFEDLLAVSLDDLEDETLREVLTSTIRAFYHPVNVLERPFTAPFLLTEYPVDREDSFWQRAAEYQGFYQLAAAWQGFLVDKTQPPFIREFSPFFDANQALLCSRALFASLMRNLSSKRADGRIIKTDLDEGVEGLREALQTSKEEVRKGWLAGLKSQEEEFGFSALAVVWEIEETVGEELFDSLNREELFALKQALREQVQPVLIFLNKPGFSQKIDFLSFPLSLVLGIKGIELVSRRKGEGFLGRIFFEGERNGLFFLEREGEILQPMLLRRKAENFSLLVDLLLLATIRDITLYYQTMRRKRKGFSWRQAAIPLSEKRLFDFFGERGLLLEARPETFFLQERVPHSIPFLARDWVDPQTAEVNNHLVYLSQTSPLGEEVKSLVQKRGAREVFQARFSKTSSLEALEKIFLGLLE